MQNDKDSSLKDKTKEKLNELKAKAEHLNVQLHLGAKEAKEEFENQKKNLGSWVDVIEEKLKDFKDLGAEKTQKLKTSIDELRVQAALGKAESEDIMDEQAKKINKGIHTLKHNMADVLDASEEKAKDLSEKSKDRLDDFHTQFDLFRLRTHLGRKEVAETWDEKKKELSEKLHELNVKIDQNKEVASEKWDHFTDEVSEAWKHLTKAFKV